MDGEEGRTAITAHLKPEVKSPAMCCGFALVAAKKVSEASCGAPFICDQRVIHVLGSRTRGSKNLEMVMGSLEGS